jgi:molybdopterin converting factor small subunit
MALVRLPPQLRGSADGAARVPGSTVREVLAALYAADPELRTRIAADGGLRRFVNVYVDGRDIRRLNGLDTRVGAEAEVTILPAVGEG